MWSGGRIFGMCCAMPGLQPGQQYVHSLFIPAHLRCHHRWAMQSANLCLHRCNRPRTGLQRCVGENLNDHLVKSLTCKQTLFFRCMLNHLSSTSWTVLLSPECIVTGICYFGWLLHTKPSSNKTVLAQFLDVSHLEG